MYRFHLMQRKSQEVATLWTKKNPEKSDRSKLCSFQKKQSVKFPPFQTIQKTPQKLHENNLWSSHPFQTTQKLHRNYTKTIREVPTPSKLTQKLHRNYTKTICEVPTPSKLHKNSTETTQKQSVKFPSLPNSWLHKNTTETTRKIWSYPLKLSKKKLTPETSRKTNLPSKLQLFWFKMVTTKRKKEDEGLKESQAEQGKRCRTKTTPEQTVAATRAKPNEEKKPEDKGLKEGQNTSPAGEAIPAEAIKPEQKETPSESAGHWLPPDSRFIKKRTMQSRAWKKANCLKKIFGTKSTRMTNSLSGRNSRMKETKTKMPKQNGQPWKGKV